MSELPPFIRHSDTSREAAIEAEPNAGTQRAEVLKLLRCCPVFGLTDHQMQEQLGMNPSTQRPRRVELVRAGLVMDSGMHRLTPAGRKAVVWIIKPTAPKPTYPSAEDGQMRFL